MCFNAAEFHKIQGRHGDCGWHQCLLMALKLCLKLYNGGASTIPFHSLSGVSKFKDVHIKLRRERKANREHRLAEATPSRNDNS